MDRKEPYYPSHGLQLEDAASAGDQLGVSNLLRYWWAWTVLEASRRDSLSVIDVGCGCGYGTRILSEKLQGTVYGIDGDPVLIGHAREAYAASESLYRRINLKIPWAIQFPKADLIVCFDVLNAVDYGEFLLKEIVSALLPGGVLLISPAEKVDWDELDSLFDSVISDDGDYQEGTPEHGIFKYAYKTRSKFPDFDLNDKLIVCSEPTT